jgi:hypothetical protein
MGAQVQFCPRPARAHLHVFHIVNQPHPVNCAVSRVIFGVLVQRSPQSQRCRPDNAATGDGWNGQGVNCGATCSCYARRYIYHRAACTAAHPVRVAHKWLPQGSGEENHHPNTSMRLPNACIMSPVTGVLHLIRGWPTTHVHIWPRSSYTRGFLGSVMFFFARYLVHSSISAWGMSRF